MTTRLIAAAASHRGAVRLNNEDNLSFHGRFLPLNEMDAGARWDDAGTDAFRLYAVCDGMGGESAGEHAAACAAELLCEFEHSRISDPDAIARTLHRANKAIHALWAEHAGRRVGCTAVIAIADGPVVNLAHVGDSRAYRLRDGFLERMTVDHTEAARMERLGLMNGDEARQNRHGALTQHLGMSDDDVELSPDIAGPFPLGAGDTWLLCSDGLSDMLPESAIKQCLLDHPYPRAAADALIEQAIQHGGRDNVTVIVFAVPCKPGESPEKPDLESTLDTCPMPEGPSGMGMGHKPQFRLPRNMLLPACAIIILAAILAVALGVQSHDTSPRLAEPVPIAETKATEEATLPPTPEPTQLPFPKATLVASPEPSQSLHLNQPNRHDAQ